MPAMLPHLDENTIFSKLIYTQVFETKKLCKIIITYFVIDHTP